MSLVPTESCSKRHGLFNITLNKYRADRIVHTRICKREQFYTLPSSTEFKYQHNPPDNVFRASKIQMSPPFQIPEGYPIFYISPPKCIPVVNGLRQVSHLAMHLGDGLWGEEKNEGT
ncbi:hypothetical protein TNIN_12851 [Trichonephila inaurata madagascariensis]|uniref:Uncharacterized protein n=1 Tax=Trichonephila inaurata madagascariensis TaxID=2747483 RepID=A0A8X7CT13_9ARAC|nr:hypothetical protein TNIN_12851 [Trichonephila inaurata madagascariensis]